MLTGALILPACPPRLFVPQPRAPSRRPPRRADLWELVWNAPIIRLYFISVRACRTAAAGAALVNKLAVRGGNEREELASHASWRKKTKKQTIYWALQCHRIARPGLLHIHTCLGGISPHLFPATFRKSISIKSSRNLFTSLKIFPVICEGLCFRCTSKSGRIVFLFFFSLCNLGGKHVFQIPEC